MGSRESFFFFRWERLENVKNLLGRVQLRGRGYTHSREKGEVSSKRPWGETAVQEQGEGGIGVGSLGSLESEASQVCAPDTVGLIPPIPVSLFTAVQEPGRSQAAHGRLPQLLALLPLPDPGSASCSGPTHLPSLVLVSLPLQLPVSLTLSPSLALFLSPLLCSHLGLYLCALLFPSVFLSLFWISVLNLCVSWLFLALICSHLPDP